MFKLLMVESERGWGQDYWTREFETLEAAIKHKNEINEKNQFDKAPDWYIAALVITDEKGNVVG